MSAERLAHLLQQQAGERLAFLPDHSALPEIAESIAALANHRGGVVLIGVSPTGVVTGVGDPDEMEQRALAALLRLEPPMSGGGMLPRQLEHEGYTLLAIELPPQLPHVYRFDGRFLRRQGAQNQPMDTPTLRRLFVARDTPFEQQVPPGAEPSALSKSAIEQYLDHLPSYDSSAAGAEQRASALLRQRGILRPQDGRPTHAGLLLFGREPQQWLPSAQILVARYAGTEMSDTFLRQQMDGTLPQQIAKAETFVLENMRRGVAMRGLQREERLEYPRDAVREAIVNAVAHRDYAVRGAEIQIFMFADRIEFHSPGLLPGHVTIENMLDERYSRNEILVRALSDLGFIERLGYGIDRIFQLVREYDLPDPTLEESANGFRLTLWGSGERFVEKQQVVAPPPIVAPTDPVAEWRGLGLNPRQLDALTFIVQDGRITNRDYQELVPDVSPETLRRDLSDLVDRGILLKIGERKGTYYILK